MILKPFKKASTLNITQGFHAGHKAIDWVPFRQDLAKINPSYIAYGTPLVAPEKSIVIKIHGNGFTEGIDALKHGFGCWLEGLETGYKHLIWHTQPYLPISEGEVVEKGQIVAYCGNSGNVFSGGKYVPIEERHTPNFKGVHLHQEVLDRNNVPIDPTTLIDWNVEPNYTILDELNAITKTLKKMISG